MRSSLNLDSANQQASAGIGVGVIKSHQKQEQLPFSQRRFCSFAIMAKVWSLGVLLAVCTIILLIILGESVSNGQRNRTKVQVVRRKRIGSTTTIAPHSSSPEHEEVTASILTRNEENSFQLPAKISEVSGNITEDNRDGEEMVEVSSNNYSPITASSSTGDVYGIRGGAGDFCPEKCERENCPPIGSLCKLGHVLDHCSCCYVCAVGEGNRCYNVSSPGSAYSPDDGICGVGLLCLDRSDLETGESPEALCECRNIRRVCGSDNITYTSECKLREAAHYNPSLGVVSWSPCVSAPWVTTAMENVTGEIGTDVSMSCEFRSFPAAIIHWEFSPEGSSERLILPGDDSSVIQTNRGGPEEMMTTSFLQILAVTPKCQGIYYCVAKNNEGLSQSYGYISVYKNSIT